MTFIELGIERFCRAAARFEPLPQYASLVSGLEESFRAGLTGREKARLFDQLQACFSLIAFTGSRNDTLFAAVMVKAMVQSGLAIWEEIAEIDRKAQVAIQQAHKKIVTSEELPGLVAEMKKQGKSVGFGHGTFRWLTPIHLAHLADAAERCGYLLLGIESELRTTKFKGVKPLIPDNRRFALFASLPVVDAVFLITGNKAGPAFYSQLVQRVAPNVYFSSAGYPPKFNAQRRERARQAGAALVTLPYYPQEVGVSTTLLGPTIRKHLGRLYT